MLKKYFVMIAGMLVLSEVPIMASEVSELPQVRVTGKASAKVTPDEMAWSLLVENKGMDLAEVAEVHAAKVSELLLFLKEQKVEEKKTKTAQMEFGENWSYRERQRVKEGYVARTRVSFSSSDFSQYKPTWLGLSKLGNVSVQSVNYQLNDREGEEAKLKNAAMLDAKKRAEMLASSLGSQIAEPLLIEDVRTGSGVQHRALAASNSFAADEQATKSSASGQLQIESQVKVVFRLVTPLK
ncbi:SIMPL domain-containing protein [Rubritalea sp.]|uniref:SIMPL domain-containing protein n=1 Tax=Rubritalea sp. TaxID=2109375 RepID=UPI003EF0B598